MAAQKSVSVSFRVPPELFLRLELGLLRERCMPNSCMRPFSSAAVPSNASPPPVASKTMAHEGRSLK
jgi:hypothetical protein